MPRIPVILQGSAGTGVRMSVNGCGVAVAGGRMSGPGMGMKGHDDQRHDREREAG